MALQIAAIKYISLSEIQTVAAWVTPEFVEHNTEPFEKMLHDLGMDLRYPYETQDCTHRNRFNNPVTCLRWVGNERTDEEWINSGHASVEAIDKSKNNPLLTDCYRLKGMVESI